MGFGRKLSIKEKKSYQAIISGTLASKVRIYRIPYLPRQYSGITIGRHIFLAQDESTEGTSKLIAHELAHVRQWQEFGFVGFLVRYLANFIKLLRNLRNWSQAYNEIQFEREARDLASSWLKNISNKDIEQN